jgi:zinc metalloprotease ZmpB
MTMKRIQDYVLSTVILAISISTISLSAQGADVAPQIDWNPLNSKSVALTGEQLARSFLSADKKSKAGSIVASELVLQEVKESLLGTHYSFKQVFNGLDVFGGEVVVSLSPDGKSAFRTYSHTYEAPSQKNKVSPALIGEEAAYDAAWSQLKAHGNLLEKPTAKLQYYPFDGELHLAYVVQQAVSAPFGYWEQVVDAESGKILSIADRRLERVKTSFTSSTVFTGVATDRKAAFSAFTEKTTLKGVGEPTPTVSVARGTAMVFDPDPRTTLNNNALEDTSPASSFEAAYFNKPLLDISLSGGQYSLAGPWVVIADFENPVKAPSKTADGHWNARRGSNAFNDGMTYFHIDQSQRYIQSLGFTGQRGIQFGPIATDTDGVDGDDNSHFLPDSNKMAFGHGCVDDNEDSDVILHEYGHAIEASINRSWRGGDTGAMGEGFGDYWGASYSLRTPNGANFFPEQIYSWDGQGEQTSCWSGRVLNATGARYVAGTSYSAHTPIAGGFQSDELWSTPLFQSLLTLTSMGIPHEDVDKIILEAHFGLGAAMSMPAMAKATVDTAKRMFPAGPHAQIFTEKFQAVGIL